LMASKNTRISVARPTVGQVAPIGSHDLAGLKWLNSLAQFKGRGGFGIEKTEIIHSRLGRPGDLFPSFHVAGTNGKGSVSCAVASILGAGGYRVGLYTSPHLERVNERIVIDGIEVSDSELNVACIEVKNVVHDIEISFFEAITLVAFLVFKSHKLDFAVIEVGLGGRLDSTNVLLKPLASVITTIDFDHENYLGDTLGAIASEKAGIIKPCTPLIVGNMSDEPCEAILKRADTVQKTKSIYLIGRDFTVQGSELLINKDSYHLISALQGGYQTTNLALAQAAIYFGLGLVDKTFEEKNHWRNAFTLGAQQLYWPNRLETIVWRDKKIVIDSAHNPAGIRSLISFLDTETKDTAFVFGVIGTKRWQEMLDLLVPYAAEFYLALPNFTDQVALREIAQHLSKYQVKSTSYLSDEQLEKGLIQGAVQNPEIKRIVCCGSMYLTGRLRKMFDLKMKPRWLRANRETRKA